MLKSQNDSPLAPLWPQECHLPEERYRYIIADAASSGRDTYISFNNGGVYKDTYMVQGGFERGQFPQLRHYSGNPVPIRAKMLHYTSDGTGRDSYVE